MLASSVNGHLDLIDTPMPPVGYEGDYFQAILAMDNSATGPTLQTLDYTINITDPINYRFSSVDLSVLGVDGGTGSKFVYSKAGFNPIDLIGSVADTVAGSSSGPLNISPFTQLWVRDTFSAPTAGAVNALQNTPQRARITPRACRRCFAPLPPLISGGFLDQKHPWLISPRMAVACSPGRVAGERAS